MSPRVLIAEPDNELRATFAQYLALQGFTVATAGTVAELMKRAMEFAPELVVSEVDFPDGEFDGRFELLHAGRKRREPLLFLVTHGAPAGKSNSLAASVRAHFVKPFPMVLLVQALRQGGNPPQIPPSTGS